MSQLVEFAANHPFLVTGLLAALVAVLAFETRLRRQGVTHVSAADAVRLINKGALVVDVRSAEAFGAGHIVNARHVGRQRYDNDPANVFRRQPAYGLVDLKLEHRVERANFAVEVRNLLDEEYYSYGIWDGAASFSAYPQPERAVYLSVAYRLD